MNQVLLPYQQRVVQEKEALDKKLAALRAFFETKTFMDMSLKEHVLMYRQEMAMEFYSTVLGQRITNFTA